MGLEAEAAALPAPGEAGVRVPRRDLTLASWWTRDRGLDQCRVDERSDLEHQTLGVELPVQFSKQRLGQAALGQRSFFGLKAHLAVDLGSDLVHGAILTGADVGDSLAADALVQGDEGAVFADKAYDSAARREALASAGIADAIMHRCYARRLTPSQRWMNTALAPIRGQVERAFGTLKRSYGWRRVRYRGLARNGAHLHLLCTAMNLRRAERLTA